MSTSRRKKRTSLFASECCFSARTACASAQRRPTPRGQEPGGREPGGEGPETLGLYQACAGVVCALLGARSLAPCALRRLAPVLGTPPPLALRRPAPRAPEHMADEVDVAQSSAEEVEAWARLLNDPFLERQAAAAEEVANLIGREPCPDVALLESICHHEDALCGLSRLLVAGDDESKQAACNLLFMLSMSEPERPFDASCSVHVANRAKIGAAPKIFDAFVTGARARLRPCRVLLGPRMLSPALHAWPERAASGCRVVFS